MPFSPRDWREIFINKVGYIIANTPISAVNPGSVLATILEATSLEDSEQYFQMIEIIRNYSLNTTSGTDLDNRAAEYGLVRNSAVASATNVTISDSSFSKINTNVYAGLPGGKIGDTIVYGDDQTNFTSSGAIIIGRGTNNVETVNYTSITAFGNYVRFNLSSALTHDHGTDETIILSQGGNRIIPAGIKVKVVENDVSPEVNYTIQYDYTMLDGENSVENVSVVCDETGTIGNAPAGLIASFVAKPFNTATVTNPDRVTNGKDIETDSELRDRIKLTIQSLSRGTSSAIKNAIIGLVDSDTNKQIVSANVVETTTLGLPSFCYIDDGTGFEPVYVGQGFEILIGSATGGESMLQLDNFPLVKAYVLSNQSETYDFSAGSYDLVIVVNNITETITFTTSDFENASLATAEEVVKAINSRSTLVDARTISNGVKIILFAKDYANEEIQVTGGTANAILEFPTSKNSTLYIYKNYRTLLSKDGETATIESVNPETYSFLNTDSFLIKIDGKEGYQLIYLDTLSTTAELAIIKINQQLQGAIATISSNNTRVTLTSNLENSTGSQVKVGRDSVVTSATSSTIFTDSSLITDFPYANQLVGLRLLMTSGTYSGNAQEISAYNQLTGEVTLSSSIGGTPAINDTFVIDGLANGNVGNPATTTGKFSFPIIASVGKNKDYTLNRTQGQIELTNILTAGDIITAGSEFTRGEVTTANVANFTFGGASALTVSVDGNTDQTINFSAGVYSASLVVDTINLSLIGGTAYLSPLNLNKVVIRTNNWDEVTGSIQVTGGTANVILGFPTDISTNLRGHYPNALSGNAENSNGASEYTFSDTSNLVIVIDDNLSTPFTVSMGYAGSVTTGDASAPYDTFRDSSLITPFQTTNFFTGFFVKFTSGTNNNAMRVVTSYNPVTGEIVLASGVTNAIAISDSYKLIPRTAKNVADYFSSSTITGLYLKAKIEETYNKYVSINSIVPGIAGGVQITGGTANNITISFASDGLVGGTFTVANTLGLMVGQEVKIDDSNSTPVYGFITAIAGTGPYTLTIETLRTGGVPVDLSTYTVNQNAYVTPRNLFNFSTLVTYGLDGYSYFIGLLQKAQWTVDGKEDDLTTYPGVKAAGVQVEIQWPAINRLSVVVDVTTIEGVSLSSIQDEIKNEIATYINNLGVSKDVIVSEIIDRVMGITGVYDVTVTSPSANIAIGDSEIARVRNSDIVVG